MPLKPNIQPPIINLESNVRLIAYDGRHEEALNWYTDPFVYYNSEGITGDNIPDLEYIKKMYNYLDKNSELYFIEILENGEYIRIGDLAIKPENLPIVIGDERYRGKGISKIAMMYAFSRLKELGYTYIKDSIVYRHNTVSKQMHEKLGYRISSEDEQSYHFEKTL